MTKYLNPFQAEYDTNGEPLAGGKLYFYEAGTTNPTPVYADEDLTTPLSNPVVADGDGRFATMYMQKIEYKIVLTDADDVTVQTVDNYDFTNTTLFNDIKVYATTTESGVVILATTADVIAGTSTTKVVTPAALTGALADLTVSPQGYYDELLPSNAADTDHDLTIGVGTCRNATGDGDIVIETAITKQIDADWATGTDAGGMPASIVKTGTFTSSGTAVTGIGTAFDTEFSAGDVIWSNVSSEGAVVLSVGGATSITLKAAFASGDITPAEAVYKNGLVPSATYYSFVLSDSSAETEDSGFDTQLNAENLLADVSVVAAELTKYQRVDMNVTDSSSNIIPTNKYLIGRGVRSEFIDYIQQAPTYNSPNTIESDTVPVPSVAEGIKVGFSYFGDTSGAGFQAISFRNTVTNFIGVGETIQVSDFGEVSSYNTNDFERIVLGATLRVRFQNSPDTNTLKTKWYEDERTI